jgi:hypothetical protein
MEVLEILKYTLPALIVFLTAVIIIRRFIKNDQERRRFELRVMNQKNITPVRLQAYERIVLLLERIAPDSLIMRLNEPNLTAGELQANMLKTIRAEFDHNLSQQVYVSNRAWEVVKSAKSNIIKIINTASDSVKPDAPAFTLSKRILESMMKVNKSPTTVAIEYLKDEMQKYF